MIPPAWRDVWISPRANAKLQATGVDAAGRRQYLYHPEYRARQEQAKYDKLVRFAERLPGPARRRWASTWTRDPLDRERVCAVAVRLINLGWFRVGSDRYAKTSRTYGVTTLTKRHVSVRGKRGHVPLPRQAQAARCARRSSTPSSPTRSGSCSRSPAARGCSATSWEGELCNLTGSRLNDYIREHLGEEFTAKDFRTWGGTLDGGDRARRARRRRRPRRRRSGRSRP